MTDGVLLDVKGLHKDFGGVRIIQDLNLQVNEGERHAVIGPNGAGKTTLFNLVTGRYTPSRGDIVFRGQAITGLAPHRINRLGISRSFQITNIFAGLSVLENVRSAVFSVSGHRWDLFRRADRIEAVEARTLEILEQIRLLERRNIPAGELAYGEQRALEIGITLATEPRLILLDEPTAGMSLDETREIVKLIDRITRGMTLVVIEHDMEVVFSLASRITVIHYGTVLASGTPEAIRDNPEVREAYLGSETACWN